MKQVFRVFITKDGFTRHLDIEDREITIGSGYKNNIPLKLSFESYKLIEISDVGIKLYPDYRFDIYLTKSNDTRSISEIAEFIQLKGFIELKKDVSIKVKVEGYELLIFVKEVEEKHIEVVPANFRENILTKENVNFFIILVIMSLLAFATMQNLILNAPNITYTIGEFQKDKETFEIGYKKSIESVSQNIKAASTIKGSKEIAKREVLGSASGKGSQGKPGGFFEGDSVISKGTLGVHDGAKNVIIAREKSLFSKIDEHLKDKPVKGYEEVTNVSGKTFSIPRHYETAKVEDIRGGNVIDDKRQSTIELTDPEKLKTDAITRNVQVLKGKRPETEIISVMKKHKKGFEFLYIEERKKDISLQGRLVLKINITSKGLIDSVEVIETDINNKVFIERIIFLVKSIRFSEGDFGDTTVKIPLVFLPT
jgi:hypothetical protein